MLTRLRLALSEPGEASCINPLIYVDSSVLLDVITGRDIYKARRGARVLAATAEGRARGDASWLVLAEVMSAPGPEVPQATAHHGHRRLGQQAVGAHRPPARCRPGRAP